MEKWKKYIIIGAVIVVLAVALVLIFAGKDDEQASKDPDKVEQNDKEGNKEGLKVEETPDENDEGVSFD